MATNIDAQLERERSIHKIRLFFRQRMNIFGNWMIPAVLWAFLFYLAIWDSEAGVSQFATTMILVPPLILALLVLVKHQSLQENLSGWVGAKLLSRLESMNQSASKQIGVLLLVVIALTFIGLRPLVEVLAWVVLIVADVAVVGHGRQRGWKVLQQAGENGERLSFR